LALTTGTAAFGRLTVGTPVPALYITNEDAWQVVGRRLTALVRGRGLDVTPDTFGFAIHGGVWLDDPAWQAWLIRRVRAAGYRVVLLDPLRSLTSAVDQGPSELQPLALFLRRLIAETGAVPILSHHDTKPSAAQRDRRQRPQRASGGGIFSIADAPIHCERVGEGDPAVSLVIPTLWKVCETPPGWRVRLEWVDDAARLTAEPVTGPDDGEPALDDAIVGFLKDHPGTSGNGIQSGVHRRKEDVLAALERLQGDGRVEGTAAGRAMRWTVVP
jgi:hypothetical protein